MERRLQAEEAKRLAGEPLDEQTRGALAILAARSAKAEPEPPLTKADGRREVASKVVRDMIDYEETEHENVEALFEYERLIEKDVSDEDLLNRPILEVVALICQELGVEPDWNLWKPEHFADPRWGLTEAELSEDAHPLGPYEPCTANWPPPGSVMPLPGTTPRAADAIPSLSLRGEAAIRIETTKHTKTTKDRRPAARSGIDGALRARAPSWCAWCAWWFLFLRPRRSAAPDEVRPPSTERMARQFLPPQTLR